MKVSIEKNNLIINFKYDPALVNFIKNNFDGREFQKKEKNWKIPIYHIIEVVDKLDLLGFEIEDDVYETYKEAKEKKENTERYKKGEFTPKEKETLENLCFPLYDYQRNGFMFIKEQGSCLLGDEPGLGKTIQSLSVVEHQKANKVLIICPSSLKLNWKDEIFKWLKTANVVIVDGTKKEREKQWKEDSKYYIMNYELLIRDLDHINQINWDFIIADEATRIKNPRTKQSKSIKKIKSTNRIALTGTPLSNNIQDVWNILDFCKPNILGNYWMFTEKYCIKNRFGGIDGYKNINRLKIVIYEYMLRRKKDNVLKELPQRIYSTRHIDLSKEERDIYNAIKNEIRKEIEEYGINNIISSRYLSNILVKMTRLKQVTGYPGLISNHIGSSKIEVLKELLSDILAEKKAIIFTEFRKVAEILHKELNFYNPLLFTGETSNEERKNIIDRFNNENNNQVLIMTSAGDQGINLQRANYIIHYDLPWSVSKKEQREGRAHRIGQKNSLVIFNLITRNTIDAYIASILKRKQELSSDILGDDVKKRPDVSTKDIWKILS